MRVSEKTGPQHPAIRDPRGPASWAWRYVTSAVAARRGPGFPDVERFCLFAGYARSGHSLIGSLLNAHPEIVIAHELDAVRYVDKGFRRDQLFTLLVERDRIFGAMGRTWTGYDYTVEGQWQGRFERLRVIGDKRGRTTALALGRDPGLVDKVRTRVGVPLRVIHHTRNPFDNIATEAIRRQVSLDEATAWYGRMCRSVAALRPRLHPDELFDLSHESFTDDPSGRLADLCGFLGVGTTPGYVAACAAVVWPSTSRKRDKIEWSAADRRRVEELLGRYEFLNQYTFDD